MDENLIEDDGGNLYPQAGLHAPPEVQAAIARFRDLPDAERAATPLLYWLLGDATQPFKMSKPDSTYLEESAVQGQYCKNCAFAYYRVNDGMFICSQIRGKIGENAWCRLWQQAGSI